MRKIKKPKIETYKVQIDSTGKSMLIYNRDRTSQYMGPVPEGFKGGPLFKAYAKAHLNEKGEIVLNKFLPPTHQENW